MGYTNIPLNGYTPRYSNNNLLTDRVKKIIFAMAVLITTGVACITTCKKDVDDFLPCEHKIRAGQTMEGMLRAEGLKGEDLADAVSKLCHENAERITIGNLPEGSFYQGAGPEYDCNSIMAGTIIVGRDANGDGKFGGNKCGDVE